jgi:hypothetical protein
LRLNGSAPEALRLNGTPLEAPWVNSTPLEPVRVKPATPQAWRVNGTAPEALRVSDVLRWVNGTPPEPLSMNATVTQALRVNDTAPQAQWANATPKESLRTKWTVTQAPWVNSTPLEPLRVKPATPQAWRVNGTAPEAVMNGTGPEALRANRTVTPAVKVNISELKAPEAVKVNVSEVKPVKKVNVSELKPVKMHGSEKVTSLGPFVWALLGPLPYTEPVTDPLSAFGGIWELADQAPSLLWAVLRERGTLYRHQLKVVGGKHSKAMAAMKQKGDTRLPKALQSKLQDFPSEVGPQGRTSWALAFLDDGTNAVTTEPNDTVVGMEYSELWSSGGWALGELELDQTTTVLARCNASLHIINGNRFVPMVADIYGERRSVQAFTLRQGRHRLAVRYAGLPFLCELLADSAQARERITGVPDKSAGKSALVVVQGSMVADVVDGNLVSPYLAVPVLNSGRTMWRSTALSWRNRRAGAT